MKKVFAVSGVVIKELYRRKDFYVLFILTALVTLLLGTVNFFDDKNIVRFLKEACLMLVWASTLVIAITIAARQLPSERENRTIFPLLAKPISRWQVLVGKFLGCWLATGIALTVFYIFFGLISASREHALSIGSYAQALWLHWQALGIVIGMVMLGSVLLTPAANVTIMFISSVGILALGQFLHRLAEPMAEPSATILSVLYFIIPHLEFFDLRQDIIHDWPMIHWKVVGLATAYALVYVGLLLTAACAAFRRKALN
jgi:ABC-type transport system involved in multi-copper enzyme maturation permease subunit